MARRNPSQVRFKFLTGASNWQDYGGTWISPAFNDGEFEYFFVRNLINWNEHASPLEVAQLGTYNVTLAIVAPSQFENTDAVMKSLGLEEWDSLPETQKAGFIYEASGGARVWSKSGNSYKLLFNEAQQQAQTVRAFTFGFVLDRSQNKIGATGWDFLAGHVYPEEFRQKIEKAQAERAEQ
jgi:hypothetical protein